ncbi:quinone oxidoreductase family protein [Propylenella binzhouense]|uniref:Quinone oxidoreductase n=1 Tax=Propylenella binzhouense TaxID=2555902 RepID=A0A964T6E7_9HYPH|nr:quinone oxidoreductase [Propylenella binzhouense]MYZ49391.1 quinone oxidoreductase [Propylenella binzhouense]
MAQAIRIGQFGGPEVLRYEEIGAIGDPGPGEVKLRHEAVGLNFIDVYYRTGVYQPPNGFPFIPGNEGAGVVVATGPGVAEFAPGDRVAYTGPLGAYATERLIPAASLVRLPDGIPFETGAAMMLKGLTAQYLLRRTYKVEPGQTILFHAAAGGVGLIACRWAKALGATVIGTAGSAEKIALAEANGCDHVIDYRRENFVERVLEITGGGKCDVVYDSIGKDTFPGSLDCLKPFGMWVLFGQSSGVIEGFDLNLLARKGSLYATRPTIFTHIADRAVMQAMADELFEAVRTGMVEIPVNQRFPLSEAAEAHRALEGRATTGASVLLP